MSGPEEGGPAPVQASAPVLSETTAAPAEKQADSTPAPAAAPATAHAPTSTASGPIWPELSDDHPLANLFSQIEEITKEAAHDEVYGITLSPTNAFQTKLILQKFLRANHNDLDKARTQLLETLKWRKEFDPLKATEETFSKHRFQGLGYIVSLENVPESYSVNGKDVVTFNVYGAVKDFKGTFGDVDGYAEHLSHNRSSPSRIKSKNANNFWIQLPPLAHRHHGTLHPQTRPQRSYPTHSRLRAGPRPLPRLPSP
jgi:phosphatidylinositol transfer protein SFH5